MSFSPVENLTQFSIDFSVRVVTSQILVAVFKSSHDEYTKEWNPRDFLGKCSHSGYEVENDDQKEIQVSKAVELLKEVSWNKAKYRVLCRVNRVRATIDSSVFQLYQLFQNAGPFPRSPWYVVASTANYTICRLVWEHTVPVSKCTGYLLRRLVHVVPTDEQGRASVTATIFTTKRIL